MEDDLAMKYGMGGQQMGLPQDPQEAMSALSQRYMGIVDEEDLAREAAQETRKQQFEAAQEAIKQRRFGAPTTSQQLAALSQALLAPRRQRGFAGAIQNVVPALTQMSALRGQADMQREEALRQLQQQYEAGTAQSRVAGLQARREAIEPLIDNYRMLAKPTKRRSGFNPITGELVDLDTGEMIPTGAAQESSPRNRGGAVPVAAVEALRSQLNDPNVPNAVKVQTRRNFEKTFGVPVNRVLGGQ